MSGNTERYRAYTKAGVDIQAGNALVARIKEIAARTRTHGTVSDIGGFGGLFKPDIENIESPVLVASTDGVGTKLKLAVAWSTHYGTGIDLVAMCVNDIIVSGAKPMFFLDYFATGKLDADVVASVIEGIADGCKQAGCVLLGGETAEMPDTYRAGDYDLAGFCIGIAADNRIVDGSSVKVGDSVIGIHSSGPHSNGYTLIREILDKSGLQRDDLFPGSEKTVGDVLLAPTIIYADCVRNLMRDFAPSGMAHITGGGFFDNIPRVLPKQVKVVITFGSWDIPPVFHWIKREGNLEWPEMLQIFNCGIGFVLIVPKEDVDEMTRRIEALRLGCSVIGGIERCPDKNCEQVEIIFPNKR
ncbi:MAG: phosphoribosylformylglycinamidine cyclo-ligase [Desulfovibrio sp.]|nr:phosphoribosylformylglycinamidine cyclo-ligase [Desulfovibrio sp.]